MFEKYEPIITEIDKKENSYTKISFIPDYNKFGLKCLTDDMISLLKRRVYDIAGTTSQNVNVYITMNILILNHFKIILNYIMMKMKILN